MKFTPHYPGESLTVQTFRLRDIQVQQLRSLAKNQETTASDVVRQAIEFYLNAQIEKTPA